MHVYLSSPFPLYLPFFYYLTLPFLQVRFCFLFLTALSDSFYPMQLIRFCNVIQQSGSCKLFKLSFHLISYCFPLFIHFLLCSLHFSFLFFLFSFSSFASLSVFFFFFLPLFVNCFPHFSYHLFLFPLFQVLSFLLSPLACPNFFFF